MIYLKKPKGRKSRTSSCLRPCGRYEAFSYSSQCLPSAVSTGLDPSRLARKQPSLCSTEPNTLPSPSVKVSRCRETCPFPLGTITVFGLVLEYCCLHESQMGACPHCPVYSFSWIDIGILLFVFRLELHASIPDFRIKFNTLCPRLIRRKTSRGTGSRDCQCELSVRVDPLTFSMYNVI